MSWVLPSTNAIAFNGTVPLNVSDSHIGKDESFSLSHSLHLRKHC